MMEAKSIHLMCPSDQEQTVPWAGLGTHGALGVIKWQPVEEDKLAGSCMASTSRSIKPRARGLRQCSEYFMKLFAVVCCWGGKGPEQAGLSRPVSLPVRLCSPGSTDRNWLKRPPWPHTQRCPHLGVPSPALSSTSHHAAAMLPLHWAAPSGHKPGPIPAQPQGTPSGALWPHSQALKVSCPPGPQPATPGTPHLLLGSTAEQGPAKVTLLGSVALPALVVSCNNFHRKRKCCTMTWGRTEPCGERHSEVRAAIPPPALPTTLASQCSPPTQPSTMVATGSAGDGCPGCIPRAESGNSSLKCPSEDGRSCLEWNCPPAPTGPAGMAQLLPTLTPATQRSQQPCASSTSPAGFFCSHRWAFGSEREEGSCEMCLSNCGEKLCKMNCK